MKREQVIVVPSESEGFRAYVFGPRGQVLDNYVPGNYAPTGVFSALRASGAKTVAEANRVINKFFGPEPIEVETRFGKLYVFEGSVKNYCGPMMPKTWHWYVAPSLSDVLPAHPVFKSIIEFCRGRDYSTDEKIAESVREWNRTATVERGGVRFEPDRISVGAVSFRTQDYGSEELQTIQKTAWSGKCPVKDQLAFWEALS